MRPVQAIEPNRSFVVVPDLHGCFDALEAMLRASGFVRQNGEVVDSDVHLVQLGDMVDRGPRPRACVQRLMDLQAQAPERVHVIRGNHEEMLLNADQDPQIKRLWLLNGGGSTLADYEGPCEALLQPGGSHFMWLKNLPLYYEFKNVLFCHAGLSKSRRGRLDPEGILWDRPPLEKGDYRAVVCGHSPTPSGRVETSKDVWSCDVGLGRGTEKVFNLLVLSVQDRSIEARLIEINSV